MLYNDKSIEDIAFTTNVKHVQVKAPLRPTLLKQVGTRFKFTNLFI